MPQPRNFTDAELEVVIADLRGTTQSLHAVVEQHFPGRSITSADSELIDQQLFECELCGWWCERSEELEDRPGVCDDHKDEQ